MKNFIQDQKGSSTETAFVDYMHTAAAISCSFLEYFKQLGFFSLEYLRIRKIEQNNFEQESIPVGCVPAAWQLHVLQWPPDASISGGGGLYTKVQLTSMNRFPVMATRCH